MGERDSTATGEGWPEEERQHREEQRKEEGTKEEEKGGCRGCLCRCRRRGEVAGGQTPTQQSPEDRPPKPTGAYAATRHRQSAHARRRTTACAALQATSCAFDARASIATERRRRLHRPLQGPTTPPPDAPDPWAVQISPLAGSLVRHSPAKISTSPTPERGAPPRRKPHRRLPSSPPLLPAVR